MRLSELEPMDDECASAFRAECMREDEAWQRECIRRVPELVRIQEGKYHRTAREPFGWAMADPAYSQRPGRWLWQSDTLPAPVRAQRGPVTDEPQMAERVDEASL